MTWLGLDAIVKPLRPLIDRLPKEMPVRQASALVVTQHYGELTTANAALINVGVLAVLSRGRPPVYHCRPSASRVVHETDLHSIPDEPPPLLRAPGIIEARRPETGERLWGDVASIGWYLLDGAQHDPPRLLPSIFLVGARYPDGVIVSRWSPAWTGEDLDEQMPHPDWGSSLIESVEVMEHHRFAREVARYLTIFGLLEQVKNGPLRFELDKDGRTRAVRPKDLSARGLREPPRSRPEPAESLDPARVLSETTVRGHLRRFRVGEGRQKVEWRYIDDFRARRWFGPRWTVERDHRHAGLANDQLVYQPHKDKP